jgi:hypothetical protein
VVEEWLEALAMSAKLGSHGDKDIAKVMAITNGNTKRDRSNRLGRFGYLDIDKYPAG